MNNKYILALDQGTTSSRAILFDYNGNIKNKRQKEFNQIFPQSGWVEHDPLEIWETQISVASNTINGLDKNDIVSIGIANQRETTILWDRANGNPIYNAIVWQDRRTSNIAEQLKTDGHEHLFKSKTGLLLNPYFSATKIKWILQNVEGAKDKAQEGRIAFGTVDSWLVWNLTEGKHHITDVTNASRTLLFNIHDLSWDDDLLEILDIPRSILPKVCSSSEIYGKSAKRWMGAEIPIGGIAGDQHAALFGQNCNQAGMAKNTYGTGCFLLMNIGSKFKLSSNKLLTTVAFKINGKKMFCYEGSIFVAGSAIQWLRDNMLFFNDSKETDKIYSQANKYEEVIFVPALTGLGAPHWQPNTRGAIFGLTRNTSQADIIKATLDSLSFQTLDLIESMERDAKIKITEIRVDGGMINNNNFLQSLSDVTQVKIIKPENIETTSLGAAYLAGLNSGLINNINEISRFWKKNQEAKPKTKKIVMKKRINNWKKTIKNLISLNN